MRSVLEVLGARLVDRGGALVATYGAGAALVPAYVDDYCAHCYDEGMIVSAVLIVGGVLLVALLRSLVLWVRDARRAHLRAGLRRRWPDAR